MSPAINECATRVVFIVSQPRAGSTLLQTMLAGHPQVLAPGETWLMLPLVHALGGSRRSVETLYDGELADEAVDVFARENLEGGFRTVQREIGESARRIYDAACRRHGATVLIDKTPRYYWIIEDLLSLIPDCRVIVLLRNPLSVLGSIITTWTRPSRPGFLSEYRADLLEAPARLAAATMMMNEPRLCTVSYSELVTETESVLDRLQRFMLLSPVEGLGNYGSAKRREYGDPVGIHHHTTASKQSMSKWLQLAASSASHWRIMDDYRLALGQRLLGQLGYDYEELGAQLAAVRPRGSRLAPSLVSQISGRPAEPARTFIRLRRLGANGIAKVRRAA